MNIKSLMFAFVGLLVFGGASMAWVGHDMHAINTQERAKLTEDCQAVQNPATPAISATPPTAKFVARCAKIGITIAPTAAPTAAPQSALTAPTGAPTSQDAAPIAAAPLSTDNTTSTVDQATQQQQLQQQQPQDAQPAVGQPQDASTTVPATAPLT